MNEMTVVYRFQAVLHETEDNGGAYIIVPIDIRREFGKGRVKANVLFDGLPYSGSIVNMGVRDEEGNICYVIGVLKSIRSALGKKNGDLLDVEVEVPSEKKDRFQPEAVLVLKQY